MASLKLKHIYKVYDGGVKAVNDFNMEIEDKEFIVFVGPSGCGKSTTLRMIAGLEEITAGELMIGDDVVNDVEPKDRNIAMVFQNYALYPHMTVRENMAFALRMKKDISEEEIQKRVTEAAERLEISQFLDRKPRALSGGQRQRVSLGRAIVRDPKVFLLDEPLSNLDAKLRAQMRTEISKLHKQLQTTFIYVTHDQVEAMTMGTRIVVMKLGVVQQIDTPTNLYDYPGNKFVASFIGTPQMNFFEATLKKVDDNVEVTFANERKILVPFEAFVKCDKKYFDGETKVTMGIRSEDVHVEEDYIKEHENTSLECNIGIIEALGSESILYCDLDPEKESSPESGTRLVIKVDPRSHYELGENIKVALDPKRIHLFDNETEVSIMPRIPQANIIEGKVKDNVATLNGLKFPLPEAIKLEDGDYEFKVPSDAFFFDLDAPLAESYEDEKYKVSYAPVEDKFKGKALNNPVMPLEHDCFKFDMPKGSLKVKVSNVEEIGKIKLLRLAFGNLSVFATACGDIPLDLKEVNLAIDFKKVEISKASEVIVKPLNLVNNLDGLMVKERTGKKTFNFALKVENEVMYTNDYIQEKLFNAAGRKVFDTELELDFSPYGALLADTGFDAVVERIVNYGTEKFAVCKINDKEINVLIRDKEVKENDHVKVALDICTLGVTEKARGIRII